MFSKYTIEARFFPTIVSAIPILFFQYYFFDEEASAFLSFLGKIEIIGDITFSVVILYFVSQLNRIISKAFFEKEEAYMPTTDFLLLKNTEYSKEYKKKIYEKLEKDFDLRPPSQSLQEKNELNARKRISEAMSLARKKVGNGKLLLQHNIEYGFWRNLLGGSILAILFSAIATYLSFTINKGTLLIFSVVLLLSFLIILIFHQFFIGRAGKMYARVLIQEYMEQK